ncbi:MAG: Nif3-like dinuclear metal center hexameric protein [Opitutales bacterium]|nr:Nif3-like dinuclear metal center hexameric protein [Opitutales bacterium]
MLVGMAVQLSDIVAFCDTRTHRAAIRDFPGAENGLQVENAGTVTKIAAAVDAGEEPLRLAAQAGADFLIVHHGLFWTPPVPLVGRHYRKVRVALDHNIAVYGSHLPLDAHPEIGNNALLAKALGLGEASFFLPYEGVPIALSAPCALDRASLRGRLHELFPKGVTALEFGAEQPERVAILTGSGRSALPHLRANGIDTLITGELRQEHFNLAQEERFNLYLCGHYATEVFGVRALAEEAANLFGLPWVFLDTACPL